MAPHHKHRGGRNYGNRQDDRQLTQPWIRLPFLFSRLLSFSSLFRHSNKFLYHDIDRRGQNIEGLATNVQHFAIDHHVDRCIEIEVDPLG